jgi:hypothetical protein
MEKEGTFDLIEKDDAIVNLDLQQIQKDGKKLYARNSNLREIADLMSESKFRDFFEKNFKSINDVKTILMFLNTYDQIEKEYHKNTNEHLDKYQIISILHQFIGNSEIRQEIVNQTLDYYKENNQLCLE